MMRRKRQAASLGLRTACGTAVCCVLLSAAVAVAWETGRPTHMDVRLSSAYGSYNTVESEPNRLFATTLDARAAFALGRDNGLALGLRSAYFMRNQKEEGISSPGSRDYLAVGGYAEFDTTYFLAGVAFYHAQITRSNYDKGTNDGGPGEDSGGLAGFRIRLGSEESIFFDTQSYYDENLTYEHSKFSLGVGAGLPRQSGHLRFGVSLGGVYLQPTFSLPVSWGRVLVSGQFLAWSQTSWSLGLGTGFEFNVGSGWED